MKTIKIILIGVLTCFSAITYAQVYSTVNSASRNAINSKESLSGLEGEAYLYKDYKKAFVRFANSKTSLYDIKYDQLGDEVVVKDEAGQELTFSETVLEFKFQDDKRVFRNGFAPIGKNTEKSFYEVLFDGKVKYLTKVGKMIMETKGYNTAAVKKIVDDTQYFIVKQDGKPEVVKNNEKSILSALGKPELSAYVKTNKLNLKNNEDVAKLLVYNDSL